MLDARRPTDLLAVVQRLTLLQIDPTAAIAPSADLVAWSRLGSTYRPDHLKEAVEADRTLFELDAMVRPMATSAFTSRARRIFRNSRCTSRRPSGAGATSRCRSSTATGWSGRSTPGPTARRRCCA
jgi:uncharacterized protein YcaQ